MSVKTKYFTSDKFIDENNIRRINVFNQIVPIQIINKNECIFTVKDKYFDNGEQRFDINNICQKLDTTIFFIKNDLIYTNRVFKNTDDELVCHHVQLICNVRKPENEAADAIGFACVLFSFIGCVCLFFSLFYGLLYFTLEILIITIYRLFYYEEFLNSLLSIYKINYNLLIQQKNPNFFFIT